MNYESKKWKRKRKAILARDGYQDQIAKRFGVVRPANTVHHIYPTDEYPEYSFSNWNLIATSSEFHNLLHNRNGKELSQVGEQLKKATVPGKGLERKRMRTR